MKKPKFKYIIRIRAFYGTGKDAFVTKKDPRTGTTKTPDIGKAREFASQNAAMNYALGRGLTATHHCMVEERVGIYL